jgi:multidrug resistance efflux pump
MTQDTIESLQARVQQLEAELAAARQELERASRTDPAEPGEDEEWGEFNPG